MRSMRNLFGKELLTSGICRLFDEENMANHDRKMEHGQEVSFIQPRIELWVRK